MKNKENAIQAIKDQGFLPLFYTDDAAISLAIVKTLYRAGVRVFEYTNRGAAALSNFKKLKELQQSEMQDLFLGIGTIKNTAEAEAFLAAGADFVVCPVVDLAVGQLVHEAGLLWIPGCMTPTEINLAHQYQAGIIKLFPANILGPSYLSSIKELFQGQLFVPTGGVEIEHDNIDTWFKAGVCAVGMGSKLISKEIIAQQDYDTLFSLTTKTMNLIQQIKP